VPLGVSTFLLCTLPQLPSVTAPSRREPLDARNFRGMGFALRLCNTKAKLAKKGDRCMIQSVNNNNIKECVDVI